MRLFGCFTCCDRADDDDDNACYYYVMSDGIIENSWTRDDYLSLGTYIGDSESIQTIHIECFPREREEIDALMGGFSRNRSIHHVEINTDLCHYAFTELGRVICNMENIEQLSLQRSNIGRDGCVALGTTLECWETSSLKQLVLSDCDIDDDGLRALVAGMTNCCSLSYLQLSGNPMISAEGLMCLSSLFKTNHCVLKGLSLNHLNMTDEGLKALVDGITNCSALKDLSLSRNPRITAAGLGYLSVFFESESCCLEELSLYGVRIGDDGAAALADGLASNASLKYLFLSAAAGIGWSSFSRLLCDTSSINNTYSSNHTLEVIADRSAVGIPWDVEQYLTIHGSHQQYAAMYKILLNHSVFHLQSFFQWDLKFLPLVADWFDKALVINDSSWVQHRVLVSFPREELQRRKLSALYQYVRGIPVLEVSDYYIKAMQKSSAKRRMTKRFSINRLFIHSK